MSPYALLEPLTREFFPVGGRGADLAVGHPDGLWLVQVTRWSEDWSPLPVGMTGHRGLSGTVSGRLSRRSLSGWIQDLERRGHAIPALALQKTLAGHLAEVPVLRWGAGGCWRLDFSRPLVMGILNVTPDSFSGDGLRDDVEAAVAQGLAMAESGADILDVGGESSRPGASPVVAAEALRRVLPVVTALARRVSVPISVDTVHPSVMRACLDAGAAMVNDVTALRGVDDPGFLAQSDCPVVLMHMRGKPATMQDDPFYGDVTAEVYGFLARRVQWCVDNGIGLERLIIDPGIGFGKNTDHNLALLRRLRVFRGLGVRLLVGVSRKRVVGDLSGETVPRGRDVGSHVLAALSTLSGAQILRVHDVAGARQALATAHGWCHGHAHVLGAAA